VSGSPSATGGADLLLCHAGVTDQRSWTPLVDDLASDHRCITYDERGFGATTYDPEDGWSPVEDAVRVMDAAGVSRAVAVGSSIGGATALDLAIAHPDRVDALVLIAPVIRGAPYPTPTPREADLEERAEQAQEAGDLDAANRLEAQLWLDGPTSPEGRVGGAERELFLQMNRRALESPSPGSLAPRDPVWPVLGAIDVPALVIVGELDVSDLREVTKQLPDHLPSARLVELPDTAHLPQLEAPSQVGQLLRDFVARLRPGPAPS
jgi:pimeloyl-ACP methyl ester carboxylesterase